MILGKCRLHRDGIGDRLEQHFNIGKLRKSEGSPDDTPRFLERYSECPRAKKAGRYLVVTGSSEMCRRCRRVEAVVEAVDYEYRLIVSDESRGFELFLLETSTYVD